MIFGNILTERGYQNKKCWIRSLLCVCNRISIFFQLIVIRDHSHLDAWKFLPENYPFFLLYPSSRSDDTYKWVRGQTYMYMYMCQYDVYSSYPLIVQYMFCGLPRICIVFPLSQGQFWVHLRSTSPYDLKQYQMSKTIVCTIKNG